jgi:CBS domain-containing protein
MGEAVMLVFEVLNGKPQDTPEQTITCEASASLGAAIAKMAEHNIGAVVVSNGDEVVGVFSERDVVKGLHAHGKKFLDMRLDQAMVTKVIVVTPDHSVDGALSLMKDNNIRHLPVVDGNELVGFVSIRDLMLYKLDYVNNTVEFLRDQVHIVNRPLPM